MTTTAPARRPIVGWLIALAGLFGALTIVLAFVAPSLGGAWLTVCGDGAMMLAFLFLFLGRSSGILLRIFFAVAAVGWAIRAVNAVIPLGIVATAGLVLVIAGSLITGVLAFGRHLFSRTANVFFLLAMLAVAVVLLNILVGPFIPGSIAIIVSVLYALILLVAGILIALRK